MGKRRKARKALYINKKSTYNHNSGPSLYDRNIAPELTPHNIGPRSIPVSTKSSSQRIQSGCIVSEYDVLQMSTKACKARRRRSSKKRRKQLLTLSSISLDGSRPMVRDDIMNIKFSYFSGGVEIPVNEETEIVYSVEDKLKIIDSSQIDDYSRGLIFQRTDSSSADIILCPRSDIISRGLNNSDKLCDAFDVVMNETKVTQRGTKSQNVRGDPNKPLRYHCIGTHVIQGGEGGITPFSAALEKTDVHTRHVVQKFVASMEHLYSAYVSYKEIEIVTKAIELVDASTFTMPPSKSNPNPKKAKIYGAMAVGSNVFLATHTDKDFAYSAVSVQCRRECHMNEESILVYFAFPALGIAIPLKVGDVLFFNPNEPHCITSRVKEIDDLYCVSLYLKSATIGLNNNSIPLTDVQKSVLGYKKL